MDLAGAGSGGFAAETTAITNLGNYLMHKAGPYESATPGLTPLPECGNAEIDQAMQTFFEGVQEIQDCAADAMQNQGSKLVLAAENYVAVDASNAANIQALFKAAENQAPSPPAVGTSIWGF